MKKNKQSRWPKVIIGLFVINVILMFFLWLRLANLERRPSVLTSGTLEPQISKPETIISETVKPEPVKPIVKKPIITLAKQTPLASKFGLSLSTSLYDLDDDRLNSELNDITSLGIGWVRFDLDWNIIQPDDAAVFSWQGADRIVAAANEHHLKLLPILTYSPGWARADKCPDDEKCRPADPALFAAFAQQAVQRYAPQGVTAWEIWNEPNIPEFWQPAPSPKDYSKLLKAAYTAIKTVSPSSIVITGGLSPAVTDGPYISPADFLSGIYKEGAGGYFDAVGMHPYTFPLLPTVVKKSNAWSQMSLTPANLRAIMTANGDAKKNIWLTEFGAPTDGPGPGADLSGHLNDNSADHVDEALQAAMIGSAVKTAQTYPWSGPMFIYAYQDDGEAKDSIENFFGIIRYDGSHKPSYDTLKKSLSPKL